MHCRRRVTNTALLRLNFNDCRVRTLFTDTGVVCCAGAVRDTDGWVLTYSFLVHDFSVKYVANTSNLSLPLIYRISGVWGSHEGSFRQMDNRLTRYCRILAWPYIRQCCTWVTLDFLWPLLLQLPH